MYTCTHGTDFKKKTPKKQELTAFPHYPTTIIFFFVVVFLISSHLILLAVYKKGTRRDCTTTITTTTIIRPLPPSTDNLNTTKQKKINIQNESNKKTPLTHFHSFIL